MPAWSVARSAAGANVCLCMKRPVIGKAGIEQGFHMAAGNMVINAVFAAVQELDHGSKGIDRYALIAFLSSTHAGTKRNAIDFPIIGGSNDRDGFFYHRACALISPNQRSPRAAPYQKIRQRLMESAAIFDDRRSQISLALRLSEIDPVTRARSHHHPLQKPPTHEPPGETTH